MRAGGSCRSRFTPTNCHNLDICGQFTRSYGVGGTQSFPPERESDDAGFLADGSAPSSESRPRRARVSSEGQKDIKSFLCVMAYWV